MARAEWRQVKPVYYEKIMAHSRTKRPVLYKPRHLYFLVFIYQRFAENHAQNAKDW